MKWRSTFRRYFSLLLALVTVLPILPVGSFLSFADTEVYLTELGYDTVTTIAGELGIDADITIGTESYDRGIYIHPTGVGDAGAASIEYDISGGKYKSFSVWVGKNSAGNGWGNNPMQFEIYVDGIRMAGSSILQYPDKEKLEIEIPDGARSLKLVAKATGDSYFACGAGFALPILTRSEGGTTEMYLKKSLTALEFSKVQTLYGVTDPKTTQREGELRIDNQITIGTSTFDKGIYLHPVSNGGSAYITYDISGMGFESFRTYVGKDAKGSGYENKKVQFEIYVDGVLMASSKELQYPAVEELSFELPPDAGELKLVAKALEANYATGCCFGNPLFTLKAKPGELVVSGKPEGENPNPVGPYTFKGEAYADSVEILVDGVKKGEAVPGNGGSWSITVDFPEKINHEIQIRSVVDGVVMQTETFKYLMNDDVTYASSLTVESWTGLQSPKVYAVNAAMSVGGSGAYRSNYGFQNHPLNGEEDNYGAADINIDIEGLGYTYFQTVVGKDDAVLQGGTGIEFIVLVDGEIKVHSGNLTSYETADLSCEIPLDAKVLTLRITNFDGDYSYGTGDWCDPILARGKDKLYPKTADTRENSVKNGKADLSGGIAVQFVTTGGLKGITIPASDSIKGSLAVKLYKYMGSYFSTMKRVPIEKAKLGDGEEDQTMIFSDTLDPGAYVLVIKGEGTIDTYASDSCIMYQNGEILQSVPGISLHFEETAQAPFLGKAEGLVGEGSAAPTVPDDGEMKAAKAVYDAYLADGLKNFPVTMKIGETEYAGFGDSRFSVVSQKTAPNSRNGQETETVIVYAYALVDTFPREIREMRGICMADLNFRAGKTKEEREQRCWNIQELADWLGHEAAMLGNLYMREERYEDALYCYSFLQDMMDSLYREEKYRPPFVYDHYPLYHSPAYCLMKLGRDDEAVTMLEEGVRFILAQAENYNKKKELDIPLLCECSFGYGFDGDAEYQNVKMKLKNFVCRENFKPLAENPRYCLLVEKVNSGM